MMHRFVHIVNVNFLNILLILQQCSALQYTVL